MSPSSSRRGAFLVAAAACLWGLWPLWVRGGPSGATVATIALGAAGVLALPFALREGRGRRRRPATAWLGIAALGLADAANCGAYFHALEGAVAPAVLSHYLAPVLVALSAPILLREPRASRTPIALVLALAGTAVLVFASSGTANAVATRTALGFGGASAVCYAINVILAKLLAPHFGDAEILSYHLLVSVAVLAPLTGIAGTRSQLGCALAGGVVSTLTAGIIYYAGLRRLAAERAAILGYLEPAVAVLVGWLALGETPGAVAALGGALVLAGGALVLNGAGGALAVTGAAVASTTASRSSSAADPPRED